MAVPRSIPPRVEVEIGERIWIDREEVQRVITELPKRLPPEAHFGFNYEDDKAWVVAEASGDLRSLVDDVLTCRRHQDILS